MPACVVFSLSLSLSLSVCVKYMRVCSVRAQMGPLGGKALCAHKRAAS